MMTIRRPAPLSHLSNTPGRTPTYRLSTPIRWHHLAGEWNTQASTDRAVGYAIRYNADRGRWYITASWSQPPKESLGVKDAARSGRCLAIDVNSGHLDTRVLDVHGNPVGRPIRETIPEDGSSAHRLGALREEVSCLVKQAKKQGVTVIAVEKLDFADRHQAAAVVIGRRSQGYSEKRKSSQSPCLPEDRHGKATVKRTANTTGMAHTTGNDRRERSHSAGVATVGAEP